MYTAAAIAMEPNVAKFRLPKAIFKNMKDTHTTTAITAEDKSVLEDTLIKLILILVLFISCQFKRATNKYATVVLIAAPFI